jgi:hypothetical protein
MVAVAELPEAIRAADPSEVLPSEKLTLLVGGFEPLYDVTLAATSVVAIDVMDCGFAETVIEVPVTGGRGVPVSHQVISINPSNLVVSYPR